MEKQGREAEQGSQKMAGDPLLTRCLYRAQGEPQGSGSSIPLSAYFEG